MQLRPTNRQCGLLFSLAVAGALLLPNANAASCKTGSQMTAAQRDAMSSTARSMVGQVQRGDVQGLRANTIPAVAADFGGIAASASSLAPLVQHAAITTENLYILDASSEPAGAPETDFYCGSPIVVFNLTNLPPGKYGMVFLHATGVPKPQQISLILSETAENHWMLAGFFSRPMVEAGHNGLWYWVQAREYAQRKMNWNAWFYYQAAVSLLNPVEFLSSPNVQKLRREADRVRPANLPGISPMTLDVNGSSFSVTSINMTDAFGGLDLEVHYIPNPAQLAQLRDPVAARKQAIDVMSSLLAQHPELRTAFHGVWVHADQGNASVYALDLPMDQIGAGTVPQLTPASQTQSAQPAVKYDPTKPEAQPNLDVDRDPVLSPDAQEIAPAAAAGSAAPARPGEIQKGKSGIYTLHEDVNEVVLNCTVVDEKTHLVTDLKRGDFRVWEDGVPQTIDSFQFRDLPVSMGILVDNSGSMRDKRTAINAAALELVKVSNPQDAAFIVNFSDKAYLDQDFTSNIAALERGLSHYDSRSTTALYDAVAASADELARHAKQPKQVLLIVTDGADNASRLSLDQAIHRVQNLGGPVVYSIGLLYGDDKEEAQKARTDLETLSEETGGIAYFPRSLDDVNEIAQEVARDIRDQYSIGYHSTKPASLGGYRTVRVEAKAPNHGKLIVRTRKGYYRKPATGTQTAQRQVAQ
jgi:Ca-activated chloride channel homolog